MNRLEHQFGEMVREGPTICIVIKRKSRGFVTSIEPWNLVTLDMFARMVKSCMHANILHLVINHIFTHTQEATLDAEKSAEVQEQAANVEMQVRHALPNDDLHMSVCNAYVITTQ